MTKAERYSADTVTESYVQRAGILNLWTLLTTPARHFMYIIVSDIYWLKYNRETKHSSWRKQLHYFQTAVNWRLRVTWPQWVLILGHDRFLHILSHSWFTVIHSFKANYSTFSNYSTYVFTIFFFMFVFLFCMFGSYFVYSVFLCCFVSCFSFCI